MPKNEKNETNPMKQEIPGFVANLMDYEIVLNDFEL